MTSKSQHTHNEHPSETKVHYGIQYWVVVPADASKFIITIGHGEHAVEEVVNCPEVTADNYQELFQRGHAHAQKIIQTKGAELSERFGLPDEER